MPDVVRISLGMLTDNAGNGLHNLLGIVPVQGTFLDKRNGPDVQHLRQ